MPNRTPSFLPALLATLLLAPALLAPAPARADAASCNADKLHALSRAQDALLRCRAKAHARGVAIDAACVAAAGDRLVAAFGAAVAEGGCVVETELGFVETALSSFEADLAAMLAPAPGGDRCAAGKTRAAARRVRRELACRRDAAAASVPYDPSCADMAREDMLDGYVRRDLTGNCTVPGDAVAVEARIAAFLSYAAGLVDGSTAGTTTTTTTTTSTTTTTLPPVGPMDLSAVVDGASVDLAWTPAPAESNLPRVRVLRRLDTPPSGPDDPAATLVFSGTGVVAIDDLADLLPTTPTVARTYHYTVFGCDVADSCLATGDTTTLAPTLVQVLRAGGYVVHWRHAAADVCSDNTALGTAATTSSPDWWKSCNSSCTTATARQLNNTGRANATAIGDAFATLGIPVGRVRSSEFCRNVETAQLMDFGPVIEQEPGITFFVYDEAARCANSFAMLAEAPAAGTNTAVIGHAGFTGSCTPLKELAWGEAAVFKPDGVGGSTFVQRVLFSEWATLP